MSGEAIVEHHRVVPSDILVGVPCYRDGAMVAACLDSLGERGVQLLIVDNGADADVKAVIDDRGVVIRNAVNRYVNPAWNQILEYFLASKAYRLLVLANSDLVMAPGWAAQLRDHDRRTGDQIFVGKVGEADDALSLGAFFAMTVVVARVVCPIPAELLVYGGDDFIFEVSRRVGFPTGVAAGVTMQHAVSGTIRKSPEVWEIGRRDNQRWHHHVLPNLVPARVREHQQRHR